MKEDRMFRIRPAVEEDITRLVPFICDFRRELYPMLDQSRVPPDLEAFREHYLDMPLSGVCLAEDSGGRLAGCIAMRRYDHRFKHLFALDEEPVVEVQKLFVAADLRRKGIAGLLFRSLYEIAARTGVRTLYLHTHPFLPGAEVFWKKHRFQVIHRETEPVFRTIHMVHPVL